MAQVDDVPQLSLPEVTTVLRSDGDAVVELRQDGQLVGELNFSKIFRAWLIKLGWLKQPKPNLRLAP